MKESFDLDFDFSVLIVPKDYTFYWPKWKCIKVYCEKLHRTRGISVADFYETMKTKTICLSQTREVSGQ